MSSTVDRPSVRYACDVLVIGSGVSGYCAAIQAGRLGCDTILVEKDDVLGGNSGPNLGVGITGADRYNPYATETGIVHEIHEEAAWIGAFTPCAPGSMPYNISRRFEALVQEYLAAAGVRVLKRHIALEPVMDEAGRIAGVVCEDLAAFRRVHIDVGSTVIEASGDGEVGALAGADFDVGSEAGSEFGERSAPAARSALVQGTSLVAIAYRTGHEVVFIPPANLPEFVPRVWHSRIGSFTRHHDGWFNDGKDLFFLYVTETGGSRDTIRDDGAIYEDLLGQLWAEWDHIKNGPHAGPARCWDLLWVSPKAGKRESRRFLGDVILTQGDLEAGRFFEDDIAWGGHDLDDHRPLGTGSNIFTYSIAPIYGIPLRACYSRNVPNLLLGGRLISATHLAHSSTRVMRTGGAIGQGLGLAAALCLEHGCTPREVVEQHRGELLARLREEDGSVVIPGMPGEEDLAPEATVTATSDMRFADQEPAEFVPLLATAGVVLWDWQASMHAVELFLRNGSDEAQALGLRVHRARTDRRWKSVDEYHEHGRNDLRTDSFELVAEIPSELPAGHEGWFTIRLPQPLSVGAKDPRNDDDRLLIALRENPEVEWALARRECEIAEMVELSHHSPHWRRVGRMATLRLFPSSSLGEAGNVVTGDKQRLGRGPANMWMSDPEDGLPQDLVLAWDGPRRFDRVTIILDNLVAKRH